MSATAKSLGIERLSRDERFALVQEIWDTLANENSATLANDAQLRELECRAAEDVETPDDVIAWEQVKAQTLAKLRKS